MTQQNKYRVAMPIVAMAVFAVASLHVQAQTTSTGAGQAFPSKPIRFIVPFPPGAATDAQARLLATKMTENWGQQTLIDNRGGATGMIGTDIAAKAPPDGHTIVMVTSAHVVHPFIYKKVPFNPVKDFSPVHLLSRVPNILVVHPSVPARTVKEFIAFAKTRGNDMVYGSSGNGSSNHLSAEMFKMVAGISMAHIPYKGGAPLVVDVIGGQIPAGMSSVLTTSPHLKSGRLRALFVTGATRHPLAPEVPTLIESGFAGFEANEWWAVLAPAGTPRDVVTKLNGEITRIMGLSDVKERAALLGVAYVGSTPDELGAFLVSETTKWSKVVKAAGLQPE